MLNLRANRAELRCRLCPILSAIDTNVEETFGGLKSFAYFCNHLVDSVNEKQKLVATGGCIADDGRLCHAAGTGGTAGKDEAGRR